MGAAVGRVKRVFRMYNIDNRVEKVLSKEKPNPAPRYETIIPENIASENIHSKNEQLLQYLHDVKVYSQGDNPTIRRVGDASHHPKIPPLLNRLEEPINDNSPDGAFGYVEPQRIPPGRVSLRQFLAYLQQYRDSPNEYSVDRFSELYSIKPDVAQRIFKYHNLLELQEVTRKQSGAPGRTVAQLASEISKIENESSKRSDTENDVSSKF